MLMKQNEEYEDDGRVIRKGSVVNTTAVTNIATTICFIVKIGVSKTQTANKQL